MSKIEIPIIMLVLVVTSVFSSCLNGSDEESEVTNDCAITNMVIGTLHRVVYTKESSGKDTSYLTTLSGSNYPMYIDQVKKVIYNPDSLPVGTKISTVVFSTITSDGSVAYKKDNGNDTLYSSTDSLDFTSPRSFTCYAYSGSAKKTYTVHVNVHKVNPEKFVWQDIASVEDLKGISKQKTFIKNGELYIFASVNSRTFLLKSQVTNGTNWERTELTGIYPENISDIQKFKNKFYGISGTVVLSSENGIVWETVSENSYGINALVCAAGARIYSTNGSGLYYSADAVTWTKDSLDESPDLLPVSNTSSLYKSMNFNGKFSNLFLSGTDKAGEPCLWKKTIDSTGVNKDVWSYYPATEEVSNPLPLLSSSNMIDYDDRILYIGCKNDTVSLFYVSADAGRSWIPNVSTYIHPNGIEASNLSCVVDENHYIWLVCGGSGRILRGRINRLSFQSNQTSFTK